MTVHSLAQIPVEKNMTVYMMYTPVYIQEVIEHDLEENTGQSDAHIHASQELKRITSRDKHG